MKKQVLQVEVSAIRIEAFFCFRTGNKHDIKGFGHSFKIFPRF